MYCFDLILCRHYLEGEKILGVETHSLSKIDSWKRAVSVVRRRTADSGFPYKLLSFAGLEPGYFQSGISESTGKMVKHRASHLRYAIMNCAQTVINNEPTFAAYCAKKRVEGKEHRVTFTHVAKKLLRFIYTLQTKALSYNPDLVR